jgi:transposase-like protein
MTMIDMPTDSKPKKQGRRRFTAQDRKRLMSLYKRSGQGTVNFCRDHEVCPSSLWRWLAQARSNGQTASSSSELVEIPAAALRSELAVAALTMQIAGGTRLDVVAGTDPEWIGALVRALTPASV